MGELSGLLLAWHGDGDDQIRVANQRHGNRVWESPRKLGVTSADGAAVGNGLMAMQGPPGDHVSDLFLYEEHPVPVAGPDGNFQTTARPAVGGSAGQMALAWRRPDGAVVTANGSPFGWSDEQIVGRSSHGPAISASGLWLAWKGMAGDQAIYWAGRDNLAGGWTPQRKVLPVTGEALTDHAPALCEGSGYGPGRLILAWRLAGVTGQIWWSQSDGNNWSTPVRVIPELGAVLTDDGPAIGVWEGGLILAWKGVNGDPNLWWSTYEPGRNKWTAPNLVGGATSNTGPVLAGQTNYYP